MPEETLLISMTKPPASLLNVVGIFSPLKYRLMVTLLNFLLLVIFVSSAIIFYGALEEVHDVGWVAYFFVALALLGLIISPCCLIARLLRPNQLPMMEITSRGICYTAQNHLPTSAAVQHINWQDIVPCVVELTTNSYGSKQKPVYYFKFLMQDKQGKIHASELRVDYLQRFSNGKQLIRAFLLNLIHLDKEIVFQERLFFYLNLDPEDLFELKVKQPRTKAHYTKRHVANFMVVVAIILMLGVGLYWINFVTERAFMATLLISLLIFVVILPCALLMTFVLSKYSTIEPRYAYVKYQLKH